MNEKAELDSSLVERAKRGSATALTRLLYEAGRESEAAIMSRIPSEFRSLISADDVIQIAGTHALQQIQSLESNCPATFLAWFQRIAENALHTEVRVLRAKKRGGDLRRLSETNPSAFAFEDLCDDVPTPRQKLEREEAILAVKTNLNDLPTTQRNAVQLHHIESCSVAETAQRMGKSPSAVRALINRAKRAMKIAMGGSTKWFSR